MIQKDARIRELSSKFRDLDALSTTTAERKRLSSIALHSISELEMSMRHFLTSKQIQSRSNDLGKKFLQTISGYYSPPSTSPRDGKSEISEDEAAESSSGPAEVDTPLVTRRGGKSVHLSEEAAHVPLKDHHLSKLQAVLDSSIEEDMEDLLAKQIFGHRMLMQLLFISEHSFDAPTLGVVLYYKRKEEFRLFFVCTHTLQVVPCGPGTGQKGYAFHKTHLWGQESLKVVRFGTMALKCGIITLPPVVMEGFEDYYKPEPVLREREFTKVLQYLSDKPSVASSVAATASSSAPGNDWNIFAPFNCIINLFDFNGQPGASSIHGHPKLPEGSLKLSSDDVYTASLALRRMLHEVHTGWDKDKNFWLKKYVEDRGTHWIKNTPSVLESFTSAVVNSIST